MSVPYNLFLTLFPESFILGPFLNNNLDLSRMGHVAYEEAEVEREIVHMILASDTTSLWPNFNQTVMIREHNINIEWHDERGSDYRVWVWHGHLMAYDEVNGYSLEYIYGYYFERKTERQ
ncbi:FK506-binding protein 5-like protein [Cinnamomum micranthum f. kanehirae]|uniref:FK506-binding protein 5-like protein n=1 Tax=Cinnamomum micranthum f. kanehirae TaxID=337451 RepID=A0A3S3MGQ6_9MAGN|nr:FK506-binding protein 5-like protein [Cinnamomum micranthum f. kanehirae]